LYKEICPEIYRKYKLPSRDELEDIVREGRSQLQMNQVCVCDRKDLRYEEGLGSDVAEAQSRETAQVDQLMLDVSNGTVDEAMADAATEDQSPRELPIRYHFVSNKPVGSFADESTREEAIFRAIASMGEVSEDPHGFAGEESDDDFNFDEFDELLADLSNAGDGPGTRRSAEAVNEFTAGDAFCQAFPHIFALGKAYGRAAGKLNAAQRNHLLLQFTGVAARDRQLLGYLDNAVKRVRTIYGVNAHVQNNPKAVAAVTELFENPEKQKELLQAIKNPKGPERKKILQEILPHLRLSGKDVPYGFMDGAAGENTTDFWQTRLF
jgi:hypothetical protein